MFGNKYHSPQSQLSVLATLFFLIPIFVYTFLHYSPFWPSCIWLILPFALPTLIIYMLTPFIFPSAVITLDCEFNDGDFLLIEGKKYYLQSDTPQVKIFFWRSGIHKIFLVKTITIISECSPKPVNTYGQNIVYIGFPKSQAQPYNGNTLQDTP